ncbi:MAG: P-loop NTPase fold protein [Solidesulfovibrio sp.]
MKSLDKTQAYRTDLFIRQKQVSLNTSTKIGDYKMRITPPEIIIGPKEGFSPNKDIFGYKSFGEELKNLFQNIEDPLVIILDAPWGSGKTTFIKMWCGMMRNENFPIIYFDAFANDYIDDAFTAIAGEVIDLAKEVTPKQNVDKFIKASKKVGKELIKIGSKLAVKAVTLSIVGNQEIDSLSKLGKDIADELGKKTDEYLKHVLENRNADKATIESFKDSLQKLSINLSEHYNKDTNESISNSTNKKRKQLIFVIDELDRCRPPFSLDLLEKIKHFFNVEGISFLLVTHITQLNNIIKHTYGLSTESETYLHKFYNLSVTMPEKNAEYQFTKQAKYINYLTRMLPDDGESGKFNERIAEYLQYYANQMDLPLRTINMIMTKIALVVATTGQNTLRTPNIVCTLCIMSLTNQVLYKKAKTKMLKLEEMILFLRKIAPQVSDQYTDSDYGLWDYLLSEEDKEQHLEYNNSFSRFFFHSRTDIVPKFCETIDRLSIANK